MKAITIRLNEKTVSAYETDYKNATSAATQAAESFWIIRRYALNELKGIFSKEEITALCDIFNGTIIQPEFSNKSVLIAQLEDSEKFEDISSRHGFDYEKLQSKIEQLTSAQVFFLIHEIDRFWNDPQAYDSPSPDINKLVSLL